MSQAPREVRCDCGTTFTSVSAKARYCSAACRKRASREGRVRGARVVPLAQPVVAETVEQPRATIADAARAELESAGRADTALGLSALALAARIDTGLDTGSAMASAVKMFTDTMAAAMRGAEAASTLDELKARRRAKRGA